MSKAEAALFDVDGVLIDAPELFSHIYAKEYGLAVEDFNKFFSGEFRKALTGQADLKDLIVQNRDIWKYGSPDEILDWWFQAENFPNEELVRFIRQKRVEGLKIFLASDQEKYRARYIREEVFPDIVDGMFVSSEVGYRKEQPEYWKEVLQRLGATGVNHLRVMYFDDGQNNVDAARAAGVQAYLFTGTSQVMEVLR